MVRRRIPFAHPSHANRRKGRELQLDHRPQWQREVQHFGLHLFRAWHHEHVYSSGTEPDSMQCTSYMRKLWKTNGGVRTSYTNVAKLASLKQVSRSFSITEIRRSRRLVSKNMRPSASPDKLSWEARQNTSSMGTVHSNKPCRIFFSRFS
jgi:hypothetical protein